MPDKNQKVSQQEYDPRWFIWTIVFLVVTGVALTTYIATSSDTSADFGEIVVNKSDFRK